ncbi:GAF and ANTAR domain-containing protein [Rhodococcus sp. IEGM 1366]|uniref:GAF and ANTAR domain-containing protein n=1 Tax=Rhodococcus sp. IEGM 1366 TaxID=3082223 RepID=UPI002952CCC9|nr:GAF and ANTAR domain-containing protein [Rhodococcus sp. IEGM 1366]MDV8070899.1 GAF and ANTAR domain-containing protein [Rhodococcus sp. IEGM 1366]
MPTPDATSRALQRLYESLDWAADLDAALTRLCEYAVELVADSDMAGVTLVDSDGNPYTAACTAPVVERIDTLQYLSGAGPCLEAAEGLDVVVAAHTDAVCRWPGFCAEARRYGVNSFLSVPLPSLPPGVRSGAVNLYSARCEGFRHSQAAVLTLFVTAAGYAITSGERYRDARHRVIQSERALDSRAVIDQAKGVLMAVHSIDADTAFASLVETSQRSNTKLYIVAEELLAGLVR